jgi:hypothetical protein
VVEEDILGLVILEFDRMVGSVGSLVVAGTQWEAE